MAEREVVAVMWRRHTHSIDVVFVEGQPDTLMGTQKMAAQMAEGFGLELVPTNPGTILWVKKQGT
ncbi:MAG TPA: hypothetical protein VII76_12970 [Acidimicrobiales bacterium]